MSPRPMTATYRPGLGAGFPVIYTVLLTMTLVIMVATLPADLGTVLRSLAITVPIMGGGIVLMWLSRRNGATEVGPKGLVLRLGRRKKVTMAWSDVREVRVHRVLGHRNVFLRGRRPDGREDMHVLPAPKVGLFASDPEFDDTVANIQRWWRTADSDAEVTHVRLFWSPLLTMIVVGLVFVTILLLSVGGAP